MRPKRLLYLCVLLMLVLTACGAPAARSGGNTVSDVLNATTAATTKATTTTAAKLLPTIATGTSAYDVDLTALSSTLVYAEVNNMMTQPDTYADKSIKMKGTCDIYHDETTGKTYYACIIKDATACCASGIEFELMGGNYPSKDADITVAGTFDTYEEGGGRYAILRRAVWLA